ncbi:MAG: hypothetical protein ACOC0H_05070 [Thermodesulfobacteriota bacterium]
MLAKISVSFLIGMLMAFFAFTANAAPITFTDEAAFMAAISDFDTQTLDFEDSEAGDLIPSGDSLEGILFSYDIFDESMAVVDEYDTTSGNNSLGLTLDGEVRGNNYFWDGDEFDLFFGPVHAIGLYFITSDFAIAEEIRLETARGTAYNSEESLLLNDGGLAYFVGMVSDAPFTSAHIGFAADGESNFVYNVDDITLASSEAFNPIPEPATFLLLG